MRSGHHSIYFSTLGLGLARRVYACAYIIESITLTRIWIQRRPTKSRHAMSTSSSSSSLGASPLREGAAAPDNAHVRHSFSFFSFLPARRTTRQERERKRAFASIGHVVRHCRGKKTSVALRRVAFVCFAGEEVCAIRMSRRCSGQAACMLEYYE